MHPGAAEAKQDMLVSYSQLVGHDGTYTNTTPLWNVFSSPSGKRALSTEDMPEVRKCQRLLKEQSRGHRKDREDRWKKLDTIKNKRGTVHRYDSHDRFIYRITNGGVGFSSGFHTAIVVATSKAAARHVHPNSHRHRTVDHSTVDSGKCFSTSWWIFDPLVREEMWLNEPEATCKYSNRVFPMPPWYIPGDTEWVLPAFVEVDYLGKYDTECIGKYDTTPYPESLVLMAH